MNKILYVINKYRIPLLTIANAFLLLILTLCFMNCKYTPAGSAEVIFFRKTLGLKRAIFSDDKFSNRFVFVDTGYSRKIIAKDGGSQDITDRYLLANFFDAIHRLNNPQEFILCDIFFDDPSPDDALLAEKIKLAENIIIPYRLTESGESHSIFSHHNIHRGFVEYTSADTSGTFLKYPLIKKYNGHYYKSLPLRMYEEIHHTTFESGIFFSKIGNKFSFNTLVIDFRVQKNLPCHRLSELFTQGKDGQLAYSDQDILKMIKNRIVVIGDFSGRDTHETIMGDKPGPIILVNAYLALLYGDSLVSGYFLLFLFFCYLLISYNIFCYKNFTDRKTITTIKKIVFFARIVEKISKLRWKYFTYPILLATFFSLFLIFFFHVYINILIFGAYLAILESILRLRRGKRSLDKSLIIINEFINNSKKSPEKICSDINIKYPNINMTSDDISLFFKKYHIDQEAGQ